MAQINANNPFVAFFIEIIQRLGQKSPKLFVILQWIAGATTAITGIPSFLEGIGVALPALLVDVENKTVAIASLVGLFISLLPVKPGTVAVNPEGEAVNMTNQKSLPFTAQAENKAAAEENHPTVPLTAPTKPVKIINP
jgi:hypothetical protein